MNDITIFIVENDELKKELIEKYFGQGITFCQLIKEENREKVIELISEEGIRRINEEQAYYDKDPEAYERREREYEEQRQQEMEEMARWRESEEERIQAEQKDFQL